jgi:hypothetical protein
VDYRSVVSEVPDVAELAKLRAELNTRMSQVSKSVFAAREAAEQWETQAARATKKGDTSVATEARRKGELERARMHKALADMAQLQSEQKALERAEAQARMVGAQARAASPNTAAASAEPAARTPRRPPSVSIDDELAKLKQQSNVAGGTSASAAPKREKRKKKGKTSSVDSELEALKRKMAQGKKPGDNR